MCTGVQEAVLATIWSDARGRAAYLQSGQLIMEQLLLKRPGVNHTTLPPQGVGGSVRFGSWVGFWVLNTGF